jgi:hypothetical protein
MAPVDCPHATEVAVELPAHEEVGKDEMLDHRGSAVPWILGPLSGPLSILSHVSHASLGATGLTRLRRMTRFTGNPVCGTNFAVQPRF